MAFYHVKCTALCLIKGRKSGLTCSRSSVKELNKLFALISRNLLQHARHIECVTELARKAVNVTQLQEHRAFITPPFRYARRQYLALPQYGPKPGIYELNEPCKESAMAWRIWAWTACLERPKSSGVFLLLHSTLLLLSRDHFTRKVSILQKSFV